MALSFDGRTVIALGIVALLPVTIAILGAWREARQAHGPWYRRAAVFLIWAVVGSLFLAGVFAVGNMISTP